MNETRPNDAGVASPAPAASSAHSLFASLPWHSLSTRVTLFTLAVFLVSVWSLELYISSMLHMDVQHLLSDQQFSTVSLIARQVDREMSDRLRAAERAAVQVAREGLADPASLQAGLQRPPILPVLFNGGALVLSAAGVVIADTNGGPGRVGTSFMGDEDVAAVLNGAKARIGRPALDKARKSPMIGVVAPIRGPNGEVRGAIMGIIDLGKPSFMDEITESHYGQTGSYFLVAPRYRQIITAQDKRPALKQLPAPGVIPGIDRFLAGYEGSSVFVNSLGLEVLISGKAVPVAQWLVVVSYPTKEAFAPIHALQARMFWATIFLTLLAGSLIWWMLRRQMKPLVDTACELTEFSLSSKMPAPLPVTREDEVGALIRGFNHMLETLGTREAELLKNEGRYRTLIDANTAGIWHIDNEGYTVFMNQTMCRMLEVASAANLVGRTFHQFFTEASLTRMRREHDERSKGHKSSYEAELVGDRGGKCNVLVGGAPLLDDQGELIGLIGSFTDITARKRLELFSEHERRVLEVLASGKPLADVLTYLVLGYEKSFFGLYGSVLLLDQTGRRLQHGAAPNLPAAFCQAIDGCEIGPAAGSCGTAAFSGQVVMAADIASDPSWRDYKDVALANGLRACWSVPIFGVAGRVLGTLAFYSTTVRAAVSQEIDIATRAAYLASLAIERAHAETVLRESAVHTQTILDNMVDGVVTIDARGIVLSFNKAACSIYGYAAEEVVGHEVTMLMPESLRSGYPGDYQDMGKDNGIGTTRELDGLRKDGRVFPLCLSVSKISRGGRIIFIGILRDITQHRLDVAEIRRLAFYDPLTGLPNRRLLFDRLNHALLTAGRTAQHGALMLLDLDHFKQLNDTQGHDVGDLLLQQVAERLQSSVREGDSVARLGGDEFVVLLESLSTETNEAAAQAELIAYKILGVLGHSYTLRGHTYAGTPSIGIVVFMKDDENVEDLLKKADVAMYQAKSAGRNTARFFDPAMQAAVAAHVERGKDLHRGLAEREFVLHYQIQVDGGGVTTGVEALVRWRHPVRGMVGPAHFIPLSEEIGLILQIGQWVLETACRQLQEWSQNPATASWTVAVNVSAAQLAHADFVFNVGEALKKTGANPGLVKLELTESMLADDVDAVVHKMNAIKALGVRFSLDDFGTGYSSLSYLKTLPLDQLKIDQSFVRDLLTDPSDAVIARTIVALGHSLGLTVIAEGVETEGQRDFLANIGCDAYQGYYFGRPVAAAQLHTTPNAGSTPK